jgi:hypothetical protein
MVNFLQILPKFFENCKVILFIFASLGSEYSFLCNLATEFKGKKHTPTLQLFVLSLIEEVY